MSSNNVSLQNNTLGNISEAPSPSSNVPRGTSQLTQANFVNKPFRPPDVIYRLTFSSETVKRLTAEDFNIQSRELITLNYDDCILVLFHVENTESYQLANIWAIVAQQTAGPVFGAINMLNDRKVAEAFTRLKADGSNPLHWAALRQYPFILVYRNRWPVAVYNGPREVQALIDYSLTLACQAGYYETKQLGGSMQSESRLEMGPYDPYTDIPGSPPRIRKDSIEYNSEEPIRGFNPNLDVVVPGSAAARKETQEIRSEEIRKQEGQKEGVSTSLTENVEDTPTIDQFTGEPLIAAPPPQSLPEEPPVLPVSPQTQSSQTLPQDQSSQTLPQDQSSQTLPQDLSSPEEFSFNELQPENEQLNQPELATPAGINLEK